MEERAWDDDQRRKQQPGRQLGSKKSDNRADEMEEGGRITRECSWSFGRVARVLGERVGGGGRESRRERGQRAAVCAAAAGTSKQIQAVRDD